MATFPFGPVPIEPGPNANSLPEAVALYQSAMFRADDCLRRARDGFDPSDCSHANPIYVDRQLMLAGQACEQARIAMELIRRAIAVNVQEPDLAAAVEPPRTRPLFPAEGPYEGGA